eukprot:scaffold92379_cov20-Tisochrysis_lutea.AAC.1
MWKQVASASVFNYVFPCPVSCSGTGGKRHRLDLRADASPGAVQCLHPSANDRNKAQERRFVDACAQAHRIARASTFCQLTISCSLDMQLTHGTASPCATSLPSCSRIYQQDVLIESLGFALVPLAVLKVHLFTNDPVGLWVHAPVAPTAECVRLVKELGAPVEYIVLPTYAYEHKAFVGPFSRAFPKAKVYVTPYQWSFPLNLPLQFFGIFPDGQCGTCSTSL